jgi:hypothetical protein
MLVGESLAENGVKQLQRMNVTGMDAQDDGGFWFAGYLEVAPVKMVIEQNFFLRN